MLIFFDVDATLITTSRAGMAAMEAAGRELFGPAFTIDKTAFAGRLDPLIIADLLRDNGVEVTPKTAAAMREGYRKHLPALLASRVCKTCPGVPELLDRVERSGHARMGLLTGNYEDTGCVKLRACGIDPSRFELCVWGDDSPHDPPCRDHLPGVGLERHRSRYGAIRPDRVVIIGDTPHDIACAKAHGCRSLGVATGINSVDELRESGADWAVPTLADTDSVFEWLIAGADAAR
jgi:phosphoglycolate phosphatase